MLHEQGSNTNAHGYTKAVDLWSLGCVTVVLLTGGYPFFEPGSSQYSEKLASTCNLEALERSQVWRGIGARPKAFVRRLLVLDERLRMTAKESLTHEWFANDIYKMDFEELYDRAISHWRPRVPKEPVIELIEKDHPKSLPFLKRFSSNSQKSSRRGPPPVDPPYKPFPRRLHSHAFFPKRRTSPIDSIMSDDVKAAIESKWTFDNKHSTEPLVGEDDLPTRDASEVGERSGDPSDSESQDKSLLPSPTSPRSLSGKPQFQLLPLTPLSGLTDVIKAAENGSHENYGENALRSSRGAEKEILPLQKAYDPNAWENEATATSGTPSGKPRLM